MTTSPFGLQQTQPRVPTAQLGAPLELDHRAEDGEPFPVHMPGRARMVMTDHQMKMLVIVDVGELFCCTTRRAPLSKNYMGSQNHCGSVINKSHTCCTCLQDFHLLQQTHEEQTPPATGGKDTSTRNCHRNQNHRDGAASAGAAETPKASASVAGDGGHGQCSRWERNNDGRVRDDLRSSSEIFTMDERD